MAFLLEFCKLYISVLFHHMLLILLCVSSCRPVVFNQRGSAGVEMLVSLAKSIICIHIYAYNMYICIYFKYTHIHTVMYYTLLIQLAQYIHMYICTCLP